ncbi:sulfite exporter TauE/SafE family protein [Peptacetobacter sp.]|uniref:sulfite exporter TauE/SafE family protein n=1 Tax=Peptacetobacter sp. TaxID=2991975 RepID=UPI0026397EAC|nr:sulfite exporter TauE/SafE family protein [Peptacetobacter sp.]MEE0452000.1 sulfite exporter TauE/SafE family protein [Peptacetobacter sp.]
MVNLVRIVLGVLTAIYAVMFGKDYMESSKNGLLEAEEEKSWVKPGIIGFIANFGDTLGIGSFAPIVAMSKFSKMKVHDKQIPGMLNVSCCIPVVTEALLMTTAIAVEPITLVSMLAAAGAGSYIGAGIISKMDEKKIQLVMGIALLATAILMFLGLPWINLMPGGGNEIGLSGVKLVIGIVGNFILGALMTAGIGLYAPCMALVYFLGMSPKVAFPIMMGSCAVLMPIASAKFIKEGQFPRKASLAITIGGVLGVFIAFYLVKSLPMDILKVLVIIVILYTSFTMLKPVLSKKQA